MSFADSHPSRRCGFSLLELMVAIAIVGILTIVAVPAYKTYATKAYVVKALAAAEPLKVQIEKAYIQSGQLPCCSFGAYDCDCTSWSPASTTKGPKDVNNPTPYAALLRWFTHQAFPAGRIEVLFSNTAPAELTSMGGASGIMWAVNSIPNDNASGLTWLCGPYPNPAGSAAVTALKPYLPSNCQNLAQWDTNGS